MSAYSSSPPASVSSSSASRRARDSWASAASGWTWRNACHAWSASARTWVNRSRRDAATAPARRLAAAVASTVVVASPAIAAARSARSARSTGAALPSSAMMPTRSARATPVSAHAHAAIIPRRRTPRGYRGSRGEFERLGHGLAGDDLDGAGLALRRVAAGVLAHHLVLAGGEIDLHRGGLALRPAVDRHLAPRRRGDPEPAARLAGT